MYDKFIKDQNVNLDFVFS